MTRLETRCELDYPQNVDLYLANMEHLGIADVKTYANRTFRGTDIYDELEQEYTALIEQQSFDPRSVLNRGYVEITGYGEMFIAACTASSLAADDLQPDE